MVHIDRITLQGFKSFNTKTDIKTPKSLVVIAGANGSGKSNIADSIIFVLGELSSKGLRTENLASLIFNGGNSGKPAQRAKVTIVFDNKKKELNYDSSEVSISREVNKNGNSIYQINNQPTTRTRAISLLREIGIDSKSYSIIKQGKIAQFVDMNETDRLQTIEDISGILSYKDKKDQAERELNKVEKKLDEARIILKEKEKRLKEIDFEKKQAEKYEEITKRLKTLQASILDKKVKTLEEDIENLSTGMNRLMQRLGETTNEVNTLKEIMEKEEKELGNIQKKITERGGDEKTKLEREIETLKDNFYEIRSQNLTANKEIIKANEKIKDLEKAVSSKRSIIAEQERERKKLEQEIKNKEKEIITLEKQYETLLKRGDKIFELQLKINSINKEIVEKEKIHIKIQRLSEYQDKIKNFEKKKKELETNLKSLKTELEKIINKESETSGSIHTIKRTIEKKKQEQSLLKIKKENYEKSIAFAVKKVLEANMPGVHGTARTLCNLPQEYMLPLTIAMGGKIDNIIVENENVAKKCIDYLKENKYGVATFLPLNKIQKQEVQKFVKHPNLIGYAVDLARYNKTYENIFAHIYFDTILVKDYNTAKEIGFNRNPTVTMEGDYISRSGSVTGGYREAIKHFDTNIYKEIEDLEQEITNAESQLEEYEEKKRTETGKIIELREKRSGWETELLATLQEIEGISTNIKNIEKFETIIKEINKLKEQKEKIEKELEQLKGEKENEQLKKEYEQLKKDLNELKVKYETRNTRLSEILLPEQNAVHLEIIKTKEEAKKLLDVTKTTAVEIDMIEKELKIKQARYSQIDNSVDDLLKQQIRLNNKIKRIQTQLDIKRERLKKIEIQTASRKMKIEEKQTRKKDFEEIFKDYEGVPIIRIVNAEERDEEIKNLEREIKGIGAINQKAVEMYSVIKEDYNRINEKYEIIKQERDDVLYLIEEIESKKKTTFMKTYNKIAENFQRIFKKLTSGEGYLTLINEEKPLEDGIDIKVRTREAKKFTPLRSLSGGEKAITAIAFIFAIQEYKPTSFYILDEIDAALDKENSEKLAEIIKQYSTQAQFIIISHNDSIISQADYLYGVSMNELGETGVVGLKLPEN